jgi:hypothetical protein
MLFLTFPFSRLENELKVHSGCTCQKEVDFFDGGFPYPSRRPVLTSSGSSHSVANHPRNFKNESISVSQHRCSQLVLLEFWSPDGVQDRILISSSLTRYLLKPPHPHVFRFPHLQIFRLYTLLQHRISHQRKKSLCYGAIHSLPNTNRPCLGLRIISNPSTSP